MLFYILFIYLFILAMHVWILKYLTVSSPYVELS